MSCLWIRSESFDHGVFNTSVRWTVMKVIDFVVSLRQAVASMVVNRSTWVEVTTVKCKPAFTRTEAVAFWHVVTVLQQSVLGGSQDRLDIRIIGLVLMCQVLSPHRIRTDHFAKSTESWPGQERNISSPRHSPRGSSPRAAVSNQASTGRGRDTSAALLSFVRQHIGYFLQIVCFTGQVEPTSVSAEEFDMLSLLLRAGSSPDEPLKRLSEVVPSLVDKKSMPYKDLRQWVDTNLMWNETIYGAADANPRSTEKTVNVSNLNKTTWFQKPGDTEVEFINITSCTDCVIYITSAPRFCLIAGCHDCTVIMTAVSAMCSIQNCEKISVHVAAHSFKMENSIDSSAYVYCHVPPILTGDTRGIKLAPFNVLYSQMNTVLTNANMGLKPAFVDIWAHPVCCTLGSPDETLGGRSRSSEDNTSTYHFVHPKNFQPVVIPETNAEDVSLAAAALKLCLPEVYTEAFKSRVEEMRAFHRQMSEVEDDSKKKRAMQAIQGHFREWLQSTGKHRQLADLAKMVQNGQLST